MSQKQVKSMRRSLRRNKDKIVKAIFQEIYRMGFFDRLYLCWLIVKGVKK